MLPGLSSMLLCCASMRLLPTLGAQLNAQTKVRSNEFNPLKFLIVSRLFADPGIDSSRPQTWPWNCTRTTTLRLAMRDGLVTCSRAYKGAQLTVRTAISNQQGGVLAYVRNDPATLIDEPRTRNVTQASSDVSLPEIRL